MFYLNSRKIEGDNHTHVLGQKKTEQNFFNFFFCPAIIFAQNPRGGVHLNKETVAKRNS
jgi:hypothetical protein